MGISAFAVSPVYSSGSQSDARASRLAHLTRLLQMNPNRRFARPQGYRGNRPFYDSDVYKWQDGLMDPDGEFGKIPPGVTLTSEPTGPVETRLDPIAWDLPAAESGNPFDSQYTATPAGTTHRMGQVLDENMSNGGFVSWIQWDEEQVPGGPATPGPNTGLTEAMAIAKAKRRVTSAASTTTPNVLTPPSRPNDATPFIPLSTPTVPLNVNRVVPDASPDARYFVDGKLRDATGRPIMESTTHDSGAQNLPPVNVTATPNFDYKKYLPIIGIVLALLVVYAMTRGKRSAS